MLQNFERKTVIFLLPMYKMIVANFYLQNTSGPTRALRSALWNGDLNLECCKKYIQEEIAPCFFLMLLFVQCIKVKRKFHPFYITDLYKLIMLLYYISSYIRLAGRLVFNLKLTLTLNKCQSAWASIPFLNNVSNYVNHQLLLSYLVNNSYFQGTFFYLLSQIQWSNKTFTIVHLLSFGLVQIFQLLLAKYGYVFKASHSYKMRVFSILQNFFILQMLLIEGEYQIFWLTNSGYK